MIQLHCIILVVVVIVVQQGRTGSLDDFGKGLAGQLDVFLLSLQVVGQHRRHGHAPTGGGRQGSQGDSAVHAHVHLFARLVRGLTFWHARCASKLFFWNHSRHLDPSIAAASRNSVVRVVPAASADFNALLSLRSSWQNASSTCTVVFAANMSLQLLLVHFNAFLSLGRSWYGGGVHSAHGHKTATGLSARAAPGDARTAFHAHPSRGAASATSATVAEASVHCRAAAGAAGLLFSLRSRVHLTSDFAGQPRPSLVVASSIVIYDDAGLAIDIATVGAV